MNSKNKFKKKLVELIWLQLLNCDKKTSSRRSYINLKLQFNVSDTLPLSTIQECHDSLTFHEHLRVLGMSKKTIFKICQPTHKPYPPEYNKENFA